MKKKMRRIIACLMIAVMTLAMGVTVFAEESDDTSGAEAKTTITITNGATDSVYSAYKLMAAEDLGKDEKGDDKFSYTINTKYASILKEVTAEAEKKDVDVIGEKDVIEYLTGNTLDAQSFANNVYKEITEASLAADATSNGNVFSNLEQGYYLIAETTLGSWGNGKATDSYSLVMLETAGKNNIEVSTKENVPTLEKKVKETNDSTGEVTDWQDAADYDINDEVPFKLTGTVSAKIDKYETYEYTFHDEMSAGLSFIESSVVVKVDDKKIQENGNYTITSTITSDGVCIFEVHFDDLKRITGAKVTKDSKIVVEFKAKLNDNAVIGSTGNPNEAYLEFANNPYGTGTGVTPKDKVIVFTYKLQANKIDENGDPLSGAGFTLYKYDNEEKEYVEVDKITGRTTFEFNGADAGKYKLEETTVPSGYNKANDLYFTVNAKYETKSDNPKLTELTVVVTDEDGNASSSGDQSFKVVEDPNAEEGETVYTGVASTSIMNKKGIKLPSTGGIGTTIFTVVGLAVMAGAAVLLFVSRRKKA